MKKLVLTEEVVKALNFLIDAAMKFCGFPTIQPHQDVISKAVVDDVPPVPQAAPQEAPPSPPAAE